MLFFHAAWHHLRRAALPILLLVLTGLLFAGCPDKNGPGTGNEPRRSSNY